jgi:hypothetical protein
MFNPKSILSMLVVAATIFLVSCQNEQNPIEPIQFSNQTQLSKVTIPYGATIDSAWFFINVTTAQSEEVTLHRVTNYWEEMMVTWDNFAGGFDTNIEGTFTPTAAGWYVVDVTSLVNGWYDETYSNYGMLLKESSPDMFQYFTSKEEGNSPYLIVWWTVNGSSGYDSTGAFGDSYIRSDSGLVNYGGAMDLVTGWQDTVETQTLVQFEVEIVYTGCTRSQGYWKTHSTYGPAPYDPTWEMLGEDSTFFLSNKSNYGVMWTPPSGGNAYYILAHQYIATTLNFLAGADPGEVQDEFDDATDLFDMYTPEYIGSLKGNDPVRQEFLMLSEILDDYNNGIIGPGKCQETPGLVPAKVK